MGSLSLAEIVTIVVVILIIFGPDRLPEFARKVGELLAKARNATSQFREDVTREWGDATDPILAAKEDLDGIKSDLKEASKSFGDLVDPKPVDLGGPGDQPEAVAREPAVDSPPDSDPEADPEEEESP
jgi:sec-independent protein translocase protein TatB